MAHRDRRHDRRGHDRYDRNDRGGGGRDNRGGPRRGGGDRRGGHRDKRQRRDDRAPQDEVLDRLQSLIFRLGEQDKESLERNLSGLTTVLERDIEKYKNEILKAIADCATGFPEHGTVYATLIGLLNARNYDIGEELVQMLTKRLELALNDLNFSRGRVLLRFIADLVNASVILPSSVFSLLDAFVAVASEGEASQSRKDAYIQCVLSALPWVGRDLSDRNEDNMNRIMAAVGDYIKTRSSTHVEFVRIFSKDGEALPQEDHLELLYKQVSGLRERGWRETVIVRPYLDFDDVLVQALQHTLPNVDIPAHREGDTYPSPQVQFRLFDSSDTPEEPVMPPSLAAERFICEVTITDMLMAYRDGFRDCAKQLCAYIDSIKRLPVDYIVLETLFGNMLQLPSSLLPLIYYANVITEIVRLHPTVPVVLALAMSLFFDQLECMDIEARDRYVEWVAHFLNCVEFKYRWQDWKDAITLEEESPQSVFVRETLSRSMRLSYYARLEKEMPAQLKMFMPVEPTPKFPFKDMTEEELQKICVQEMMSVMRNKGLGHEHVVDLLDKMQPVVMPHMDATESEREEPEILRRQKLVVFLVAGLTVGSKSFGHVVHIIEKNLPVFETLCLNGEDRLLVIRTAVKMWERSPQMVCILINKLLTYRVLDTNAIVNWVFSDEMIPLYSRLFVWEVLFNTLDHVTFCVSKADKAYRRIAEDKLRADEDNDVGSLPRLNAQIETAKTELERAARDQKEAFLVVFQHFVKVIGDHVSKCEKEGTDIETRVFYTMCARLKQSGRKYWHPLSQGIFNSLQRLVFSDIEGKVKDIVLQFPSLLQS